MSDATQSAALANSTAQQSELQNLEQQVNRLKNDLTPRQNSQQKLRKACNDFEAVFISKMWEQMRATIPKGGLMHSPQEDMYRSMFDRDFAEKMASDGGIGISDMLYDQLKGKLKTTKTITGTTGLDTAAAAKAIAQGQAPQSGQALTGAVPSSGGSAMSITPGTTSGRAAKGGPVPHSVFKAPSRSGNGLAKPGGTGATGRSYGMQPAANATITSPKAQGSLSLSSVSAASVDPAAPKPPASVSGDVMADVDALAKRIEADYDHKLRVNGLMPGQATYSGPAQGGRVASGYDATGAGAKGYGENGSTGRKIATIG